METEAASQKSDNKYAMIAVIIFIVMIIICVLAGLLLYMFGASIYGGLNPRDIASLISDQDKPSGDNNGGNTVNKDCITKINPRASQYIDLVNKYATNNSLDPALVAAQIEQESKWNPNAGSPAGAQGLMQLMPATAAGLGVTNARDPEQNIMGGTKYLAQQYKTFGRIDYALAAYNAGPGAVQKYNGIPPYPETQQYVKKILNVLYPEYKKCLQGQTTNIVSKCDDVTQKNRKDLDIYKKQIQEYSKQHYHDDSWQLTPKIIVLHFTGDNKFPENLISGSQDLGETTDGYKYTQGIPGLSAHYVIDNGKIYQTLPIDIKSRGAYGVNKDALNIEMVAINAGDLSQKTTTLNSAANLVTCLMKQYNIPISKVYGHYDVNNGNVVEYLNYKSDGTKSTAQQDYTGSGNTRTDPGVQNLNKIKELISK